MTIREKIRKLEVLEQIIAAIDCSEEAHRNDANRYRDRAIEESDDYWDELASIYEEKADYFHSYKVMLLKQELK